MSESGAEELKRMIEQYRSSIESEIGELRDGLNELRQAIADLRVSLSELENPFNLLKSISSEGLKPQSKPVKPASPEGSTKAAVEVKPAVRLEKPKPLEVSVEGLSSFEAGVPLLRWVWNLLDVGMSREDVVNLTTYCECIGCLPAKSSEHVEYVVDTMIKAKLSGLSLEEFLLMIYSAARCAGLSVKMGQLEEAAFTLLRKVLKRMNSEG